jgi:hypothetical protein
LIRSRTVAAVAAMALSLTVALAPATAAAGGGPDATKSGVLVNFVSTGKLKIAKRITILIVCSANCQVAARLVIVAPGPNFTTNVAGPLNAGVAGGPYFQPNGPLLRAMKDKPGRFKVRAGITATNTSTGAVETISRTFRLKR